MAELPSMSYYGDAYMADTRHLTLVEHGAYHLLLLIAWRSPNQALPNDDKRIAQMLGISGPKWAKIKPAVMAFWFLSEHGWQQKRLLKEFQNAQQKRKKCADAANERWNRKPLKTNDAANANAYANAHANADATISISNKKEQPNGCLSAEPTLTPKMVVEAWNERMVPQGFPAVKRVTGTRLKYLKARIRDNSIDDFQKAMGALERSRFCRGENRSGWHADFDFFVQERSFTKLQEGSFDH